ncbi:MAG: hypothetical protein ACP5KJ_03120 [Candidatus Micrarchaeia archaeon]
MATIGELYVQNAELLGVPLALMLSYIVVGLAYMVSKIFSSPQIEQWSKVELNEAFITTLYAASILAIVGVFDVAMSEFESLGIIVSPTNITDVVQTMVGIGMDLVVKIAGMYSYLSIVSWLSYSPGISMDTFLGLGKTSFSYMSSPLSFFGYVLEPYGILQTVAIGGVASVIGQYVVYILIKDLFLGYLLPFSLVLRAFPITRKLGSTLLAIVVGAYFFYPLSMGIMMASTCNLKYNDPTTFADFFAKGAGALGFALMEFFKKLLDMLAFPVYIYRLIEFLANKLVDEMCNGSCSGLNALCCGTAYYIAVSIVFSIWPYVLYLDLYYTVYKLIFAIVSFIAAFVATIGTLIADPTYFADMVSNSVLDHIAGFSVLYAYAFFAPIFSFMFTLLGIRTMLTLFGGDEVIVNMLSFL